MNSKAASAQGRYMALNLVPNQKLTMTSLFSWHQIYVMASTSMSMRKYTLKIMPPMLASTADTINRYR